MVYRELALFSSQNVVVHSEQDLTLWIISPSKKYCHRRLLSQENYSYSFIYYLIGYRPGCSKKPEAGVTDRQ